MKGHNNNMSNHLFFNQKKLINIAKYLVLNDLIYSLDVKAKELLNKYESEEILELLLKKEKKNTYDL
jgi:hypothetical protein